MLYLAPRRLRCRTREKLHACGGLQLEEVPELSEEPQPRGLLVVVQARDELAASGQSLYQISSACHLSSRFFSSVAVAVGVVGGGGGVVGGGCGGGGGLVDWWTFCTQFVLQLHLGQDITERVLPELQTLHPAEVELGRNLQNAMGKFSGRFQMLSVIFSGLKSEETISSRLSSRPRWRKQL